MHTIPSGLATALPFASGWMLLWSLTAVIPFLIYYWRKQHQQKIPWAATRLVRAAAQHQSRRFNILHWLLLALRMTILLMLAIAVAGPFRLYDALTADKNEFSRTHFIMVFDTSYSMSYLDNGQSLLQHAKDKAIGLLEQSGTGDGFSIVLMNDSAELLTRRVAHHKPSLKNTISQIEPSEKIADSSAAIQTVASLLSSVNEENRFDETEVWFFTDLASNTWKKFETGAAEPTIDESLSSQMDAILEFAKIKVFPIEQTLGDNIAVTDIFVYPTAILPDQEFSITATIASFGAPINRAVKVEFLENDQVVDAKSIQLDWHRPALATFTATGGSPGDHQLSIRISSDNLKIDDVRYQLVTVRENLRILCIENRAGDAFNVAAALSPDESGSWPINITTTVDRTWVNRDIAGFDCLIFCNIASFRKDDTSLLSNYLRGGGSIVFFLGDQVDLADYNNAFASRVDGLSPLPAELLTVVDEGDYRFDPLNYVHPIVAPFRGFEQSGLLTTPIWKYVQLKISPEHNENVALKFQNGDPALVAFEVGRGRTVVYAGSVTTTESDDSQWSAIEGWWSFPPLINEIVLWATSTGSNSRNRTVGETVSVNRIVERPGDEIKVYGPDESTIPFAGTLDRAINRISFGPVEASGIYEITGGSSRSKQRVAVNIDPTDSNTQSISIDNSIFATSAAEQPIVPNQNKVRRDKRYLFQYLIAVLLLLLLAESILAWRLGRRKKITTDII